MDIKQSFKRRDALLIKNAAFPAAAATPTYTEALDLGEVTDLAYRNLSMELLLSSPEMTTTNLPEGESLAFGLEFSDDPDFGADSSVVTVTISDWSQAGSATGAMDIVRRFRPSTDSGRFVRAKCTLTGNTAVLTGTSFSLEIVS